jgi:hypothetical protein
MAPQPTPVIFIFAKLQVNKSQDDGVLREPERFSFETLGLSGGGM